MDCFLKRTTQSLDGELELWHLIKCVHRGKYAKKALECPLYAKKSISLVGCTEGGDSREYPKVEGIG